MGTTISAQPAPSGEEGSILEDIADSREAQSGAMTGPDIEADIARDFEKRKGK
jgi:hypothetical protein